MIEKYHKKKKGKNIRQASCTAGTGHVFSALCMATTAIIKSYMSITSSAEPTGHCQRRRD